MFCRFKDYRRIATRHDKFATNFLGAIYLVAAVTLVMSPGPSTGGNCACIVGFVLVLFDLR